MKNMLTLEEGQMLEETLRKSMSQQSRDAQFQQSVDVKNQQLEAHIAQVQLGKAESDRKLSHQEEQLNNLRAHYESNRTRELSRLQASQASQQPDGMAPAHPSYEWHKQKPPESGLGPAGGNLLTRTDEPKPFTWQPTSVPSQPELRNQAGGNPKCKAEKEKEKPRLFAPNYNMAQDEHEYWYPQGSENQSRHKESDFCRFDYQPNVHNARPWWLHIKKEVAKVSGNPDVGYKWISKVEDITDPEDLQDSEGRNLLDSKVAAAFSKILHGALGKQWGRKL